MNCETPKYNGYKMDKRVPINGLGHMVNDNPSLIYKDFPDVLNLNKKIIIRPMWMYIT